MEYRLTVISLVIGLLLMSTQAFADHVYYEPEDFAKQCPVIIRGIITKTDKDSAYIRVDDVYKNVLKNFTLKKGDILPVRMSPLRENIWTSIDIRYEKGTEGIWLIALYAKTAGFTIHMNPVQRQSSADEGTLRSKGVFLSEEKILPNGKTAVKRYSIDEWVTKIRQEAPARAEARKAREMQLGQLMAPVAAGSSVAQYPYDSGQNLYMWSKEYKKPDGQSDKNRFEAGMFIGYVSAVHVARNGDRSFPRTAFCTPTDVTRSQLCDVVAKYLKEHPEETGTFSAQTRVALALAKAFPCEKR